MLHIELVIDAFNLKIATLHTPFIN